MRVEDAVVGERFVGAEGDLRLARRHRRAYSARIDNFPSDLRSDSVTEEAKQKRRVALKEEREKNVETKNIRYAFISGVEYWKVVTRGHENHPTVRHLASPRARTRGTRPRRRRDPSYRKLYRIK